MPGNSGWRSDISDAALRSGKIGPREAEGFAYFANRMRVELVVRADERHFSSPPLAADRQNSVTFPASFVLRIEVTALFG